MNSLFTNLLLASINFVVSAILVVGFSLFVYTALHNWRNAVARSFCWLLGSLIVVLGGAVLLGQARTDATLQVLWRMQWFGIALVPAAYSHFGASLLRSTGARVRWTRWGIPLIYASSMAVWLIAVASDWIVRSQRTALALVFFVPGPLFWLFVCGFVGLTGLGVVCIRQARNASVTPASRRRLSYLSTSFMAPMLGAFPYLMIAATIGWLPLDILLMLLGACSTGVGVMITLMAYSVAFHGVIVPDRIIKYNFLRYILYGPVVGVTLVICFQLVDPLVAWTGLPRETITTFGIVVMTVLMPMFIGRTRPTIDMLIYRQDRAEMSWLRNLEQRAFTRSDLRHLLENTLIAVCGTLGADSGFVAAPSSAGFIVQASCGSRRTIKRFLQRWTLNDLIQAFAPRPAAQTALPDSEAFMVRDGFCLLPLYNNHATLLGAIGVECPPYQLTRDARRLIGTLAYQMELALSHAQLQQGIFDSLRGLAPQAETLHQLTTEMEQTGPAMLAPDVAMQPDFSHLVKDALSHYWGGPKLSSSPLLGLRAVRSVLDDEGGSPTRALQAVLRQAIEHLRPDEQLDPTAPEWMLFNILELRFLKGLRIREIIHTLAMSESDFYRKQRVAVEEVARQLALMEEQGGRS